MEPSRLIIQSDWEESLRLNNGNFWISCRKSNASAGAIHSSVRCETNINVQSILIPEDDYFSIVKHDKRHLILKYTDQNVECSCKFQACNDSFVLHGKNKKVNCLDVTTNGLGLSSCESSTEILIWESDTGDIRRKLEGHLGDIYVAKFFPSGVVVLSGGADMQIRIWSAETGDCAATLTGHKAGVRDVAFVERGRNVVSCSSDSTARLWDVSKQKYVHSYTEADKFPCINCCMLVSDEGLPTATVSATPAEGEVGTGGKLLLTGCEDSFINGYSLLCREKVLQLQCNDAVNCLTSVSGNVIACGTHDGHVYLFDLRNASCPLNSWLDNRSSVLSMASYKQGFFYSCGDGSCVYVDELMNRDWELTGSDCDPLYRVVNAGNRVFTSCRDGTIRSYRI